MEFPCPVCEAPEDRPLHKHFGGQSCNSCRAFFRRCHTKSIEVPKMVCKSGEQCDITKFRSTGCKKCRYKACIRNGMKPELVLQGENKAKYDFSKERMKKAKEKAMEQSPPVQLVQEQRVLEQDQSLDQYVQMMSLNSTQSPQYVTDLLHFIISIYMMSCNEAPLDPNMVQLAIQGHMKPQDWKHAHTIAVIKVFKNYQDVVAKFSTKSYFFQSLVTHDQETLYAANSNLLLHSVIAQYFCAKTAVDQLGWLLGKDAPLFSDPTVLQIKPIGLEKFNETGEFIALTDPNIMRNFLDCIRAITDNFKYPSFYNGLLLNCLLFYNPGNLQLKETCRVKAIYETSKDVIKNGFNDIGCIDTFINALDNLESVLTSKRIWGLFQPGNPHQEQEWSNQVVASYMNIIDDISDPMLTYRYIQFLGGDKRDFVRVTAQFSEIFRLRFQLLLESIINISVSKQERINLASTPYHQLTRSLILIKTSYPNDFENLKKFSLGRKSYQSCMGLDSLTKSSPLQGFGSTIGNLSEDMKKELPLLFEKVYSFIEDDDVYVLLNIMLLLHDSRLAEVQFAHDLVWKSVLRRLKQHNPEKDFVLFWSQLKRFGKIMQKLSPSRSSNRQ